MGENASYANEQFQCIIYLRTSIKHQYRSRWRSKTYTQFQEEVKNTNVFVNQENLEIFFHKITNPKVKKNHYMTKLGK